jgi:FAD synthase
VAVEFAIRIRGQMVMDSTEALVTQMAADVAHARGALAQP